MRDFTEVCKHVCEIVCVCEAKSHVGLEAPGPLNWPRERSLLAHCVTPKAGTEQEGKVGSEEWNVTRGNANCPWQLVQKACSPWLQDLWYFTKSNGTWQPPPQGQFWLGYLKRHGINTPTNTQWFCSYWMDSRHAFAWTDVSLTCLPPVWFTHLCFLLWTENWPSEVMLQNGTTGWATHLNTMSQTDQGGGALEVGVDYFQHEIN